MTLLGSLPLRAADLQRLRVPEGYVVEQIHAVNPETEGSWIALAVDPQGRLFASDQYGGIFRITPSQQVASAESQVERLTIDIGHAHGLLFANQSLYVIVGEDKYQGSGLYRVRDTDGDDRFDDVSLLRRFDGTGEHGVHAVVLGPEGKSLYVCAGNKTAPPAFERTSVPQHWGEDDLLPRIWGPIGSEAGTPAPGGWIAETDFEGKQLRLVSIGFRNAFDLAFNRHGDLFTFDADAEFDMGTPWYQPTRVLHVVAGTDFGWRSGAGKWPSYYPDTLPPVVEVGAGSPTGIAFAADTNFPRHQGETLFLGDWSYGRILALRLTPDGASYRGQLEEFISAVPLPVTDLVANPVDGHLYFSLGGRRTTSGLFRVRYVGSPGETTSRADAPPLAQQQHAAQRLRELRKELEARAQSHATQQDLDFAWPQLAHPDRFIRHAARIVVERAAPELWEGRALQEPDPLRQTTALLALARAGDPTQLPKIAKALRELPTSGQDEELQLTWLRCLEIALLRMRPYDPAIESLPDELLSLRARLEASFPTANPRLNAEMAKLLVYFQSPQASQLLLDAMESAPSATQQLHFAMLLRHQHSGWTQAQRERFFGWLDDAAGMSGGLSFSKYIETIRADSVAWLPPHERAHYADPPLSTDPKDAYREPREIVRRWTVEDLVSEQDQSAGEAKRGRAVFAEARCIDCHRFQFEGGTVGPDLSAVARRFSRRDMLEAILDPDKVISDQYAAVSVVTDDGRVITGRLVNLVADRVMIQTDMLRPAELSRIAADQIEQILAAPASMMPKGLLDTFTRQEIEDLLAYLMSGTQGDGLP